MKKLYLFFLLVLGFAPVKAQIDTSFWFVAPDISAGLGQSPIKMYFTTYSSASTVYLRQPANGAFTPITINIPANSVDSVDLTPFIASVESTPTNSVLTRGIYISTSSNVSAVYCIKSPTNKEMISLKGQKSLGTDFYTPFQNQWRSSAATTPKSFSAIDIVASQNNTTILITPRANIIGHVKDVTFPVILNAGESFSCQDTSTTAPTKLAGSIISADKPIAVTVSSSGLINGGCTSTIADQITNSNHAGNDFVITKSETGNDKVFILATVNSTSITLTNGTSTVSTLINTGETYSANITQELTYIKSTKPVYVIHVTGHGCKLSGAQVPHFYCAGTYSTSFTRTSADSFAVNVFTRNGFQGNFQLNGNASLIPASAFTIVPGTSSTVVGARVNFNLTQVPVGSYNIITNTGDIYGFGTHQGSTPSGSSYAYHSEWISYPMVAAGPDATICSNTSLSLNGVVGGGNVTGVWSTNNGFGTFSSPTTSLNNVYVPSLLDIATVSKPYINLILTSTGPCTSRIDTLRLVVLQEPLVNASVDQIKCGNNATVSLNGSISGITSTGQWSTLGSGSFAPTSTVLNGFYVPSSADTTAGSVNLVLTSTNNGICLAETDTVKITFTKPPLVNAGPTTMSLCVNNPTISLLGSVSGSSSTGKWTTSGTGIFNPSNIALSTNYLPSPLDIASGSIYIYLISTNNGNCYPVKDSIQVFFTPSPNVNAGPDLFSCKNNSAVQLNGIIGGATSTGTWSGGGGSFSPSNSVLTPTYIPTPAEISAGFVVLNLTSTNNGNCLSVSDQVRIDFKDKPFANFSSNVVCLNQATTFIDFSAPIAGTLAGWNWSFGDGGTSTVSGPVYTYTTSGTYTAQLIVRNSFNCYDTTTKVVKVNHLPNSDFTYSRSCFGSFLQINFKDSSSIASPDTVKSFFWNFNDPGPPPLPTSSLANPSVVFSGPGSYSIFHIVTSNNGCKDTIIKSINITPPPVAGFILNYNAGINLTTIVTFTDVSQNSVAWSWNFGDGNTSTIQNPTNTYLSNGTYTIVQTVYDQFGCPATSSKTISINNIKEEINELIPNAISPNGDQKNDIWRLDFINAFYPNAEIEIYNRWGERLFYSKGYEIPWDGTYLGNPLPVSTYYYIINLNDPNREENIFKGTILIMK